MVLLKAKQSFLTMQYSFITTSPFYTYKAGHGTTDFLNCDNNGTQDVKFEISSYDLQILLAMHIPLMIDYINLYL